MPGTVIGTGNTAVNSNNKKIQAYLRDMVGFDSRPQ